MAISGLFYGSKIEVLLGVSCEISKLLVIYSIPLIPFLVEALSTSFSGAIYQPEVSNSIKLVVPFSAQLIFFLFFVVTISQLVLSSTAIQLAV